jgi:hypothetical protein
VVAQQVEGWTPSLEERRAPVVGRRVLPVQTLRLARAQPVAGTILIASYIPHAPCIMHHAHRTSLMHHASCIMRIVHPSCTMHHVSCASYIPHAPCIMYHAHRTSLITMHHASDIVHPSYARSSAPTDDVLRDVPQRGARGVHQHAARGQGVRHHRRPHPGGVRLPLLRALPSHGRRVRARGIRAGRKVRQPKPPPQPKKDV